MNIYCQPEDCDTCPYDDCIGEIRKKPGRKKMDPAVVKARRNARSLQWYYDHREEVNRKKKEKREREKAERDAQKNS